MVFMLKDATGKLALIETKDLEGEAGMAYRELAKHTNEWFSEGDIEAIANTPPEHIGRSAVVREPLGYPVQGSTGGGRCRAD